MKGRVETLSFFQELKEGDQFLHPAEYADFASFKYAILANTSVDSSHINDANPRLIYQSLNGDTMDITFDSATNPYNNTHKINNTAVDYDSSKLFRHALAAAGTELRRVHGHGGRREAGLQFRRLDDYTWRDATFTR